MAKQKGRYWVGVLYPENMIPDWQDEIGDKLQVPYAYCVHDKSKNKDGTPRKEHVHVIIAFPNTTTYDHALEVLDTLSAEGKTALNKVERVNGIRNVYDYLIHNTEDCRKKGKEPYDPTARVTGNNFDIGAYEQIGTEEKNAMCQELCDVIITEGFTNFTDFYVYVMANYQDKNYFDILKTYSGLFERLTKANFQKCYKMPAHYIGRPSATTSATIATTSATKKCCPHCGSIDIKKNGKTLGDRQKWICKDCGKSFAE